MKQVAGTAAGRFGRSVATAAVFNIGAAGTAGLAGIVIARSLGPTVRGEYAAILAWYGTVLVVGELGQTAATTYFVARHRDRAPDYLATSRTMMVASGLVALTVGFSVTPLLAADNPAMAWGYRLMFGTCLAAFVGASYIFSLQSANLRRWNFLRLSQQAVFLVLVCLLYAWGRLDLMTVLVAYAATIAAQTMLAHRLCRLQGLTGGHADRRLARPMIGYGMSQLAASVPTLITTRLDQLILSLTVVPAALGHYAVATSLTTIGAPVVAAIGFVAFPRLASRVLSTTRKTRLERWSLLTSAAVSLALMLGLTLSATWLVPALFGASYAGSVALLWLLAPGGVFLACGQVCGDLLRGYGRPLAVARAQWAAAIATVVLLVILLPAVGISGAAIASTVAYGVALALMMMSLRAGPAGVAASTQTPEPTTAQPVGSDTATATAQPVGSDAP